MAHRRELPSRPVKVSKMRRTESTSSIELGELELSVPNSIQCQSYACLAVYREHWSQEEQ
jgi:hypothetical protein